MCTAAMAFYPKLLLRARELTGSRFDAEDLVGVALLAMVAKPPEFQGAEPAVSYDAMSAWSMRQHGLI